MESESADVLGPVFFFKPKYRLSHPENYLISLSNKYFTDQSIQKTFYSILKKEALIRSLQNILYYHSAATYATNTTKKWID